MQKFSAYHRSFCCRKWTNDSSLLQHNQHSLNAVVPVFIRLVKNLVNLTEQHLLDFRLSSVKNFFHWLEEKISCSTLKTYSLRNEVVWKQASRLSVFHYHLSAHYFLFSDVQFLSEFHYRTTCSLFPVRTFLTPAKASNSSYTVRTLS